MEKPFWKKLYKSKPWNSWSTWMGCFHPGLQLWRQNKQTNQEKSHCSFWREHSTRWPFDSDLLLFCFSLATFDVERTINCWMWPGFGAKKLNPLFILVGNFNVWPDDSYPVTGYLHNMWRRKKFWGEKWRSKMENSEEVSPQAGYLTSAQ